MRIPIGKSMNHFSMLLESLFLFFYYRHIEEIPTNKEANSYNLKLSKIGNCQTMVSGLKFYVPSAQETV